MKLTIGMPCYNDLNGVFFTVQALRAYHDLTDCEILVVDNYGDKQLKDWCEYWGDGSIRYERYTDVVGTAPAKQRVFEKAKGDYVLCIDCHVLLLPHSLDRLWEGDDLIHGAMIYDDVKSAVLHMDDKWSGQMWGVWGEHTKEIPTEPFEIKFHGGGLIGCRREAWLGFNPKFRGFGGEEGYIQEKFRKAGRKVWCLPWIRWIHRFGCGNGYPLKVEDKIRNYLIGFEELGLDPKPIYEHFGMQVVKRVKDELS